MLRGVGLIRNTLRRCEAGAVAKALGWLPRSDAVKGVRSPHLWIITALMALGALNYYIYQIPLANIPLFKHSFFTSVHDLHRTLFLIPIIYAALVFRVRGSLIASFAFLCVVLPRALLFSPYPDPLLRPLIFVIFATLTSLLIATQINRVEREREAQAELSTAYKKLSEYDQHLRESQERLIQAEKLTSLGQLAASIAHEINNPLSGVLMYVQLLTKKINSYRFSKKTTLEYLEKMDSGLTHSTKVVRNLLDFARQSSPIFSQVDSNEVVNRSLDLAAHLVELKRVRVVKELDTFLPKTTADFAQLQQVCTNLIMNAVEAMPQGGNLTIRTSAVNDQVKIEVQDTGVGISPDNMRKLFTPFFSTKREVKGVGLGLAVSYGIIERHHGRIEVQSKEGQGATFTVYLPVHHEGHGGKG